MAARTFSRLTVMAAGAALGLAFGAGASSVAADTAPLMVEHTIAVADLPNALCNDGTRPAFYFQPGSIADRNKWLIVFQDGSGCTTDAACTTRAVSNPYFTSSSSDNIATTMKGEGILSVDPAINPDFFAFNHVFLRYRSSDGYAGDTARVINGQTWQFRGRDIVDALVEQLSAQSIDGAPKLSEATDVLLAGSSSGAMGVQNNLDRIAPRLAPATVKGIVDSDWVPPGIIPFAFGSFAARPDQPAAMAYFNAQPDDSCVAANPKKPGSCLNEAFVYPYVTTPMFVYSDQRDPNILGMLGIATSPTSADQADYVTGFAASVRDTLHAAVPAYYAPDVALHDVLLWPQFARMQAVSGQTFGSMLHAWYFGQPGNLQVADPAPGAAPLSLGR